MWQNLKKEFHRFKSDMAIPFEGNPDLLGCIIGIPFLIILILPPQIIGFFLEITGCYALMEGKQRC